MNGIRIKPFRTVALVALALFLCGLSLRLLFVWSNQDPGDADVTLSFREIRAPVQPVLQPERPAQVAGGQARPVQAKAAGLASPRPPEKLALVLTENDPQGGHPRQIVLEHPPQGVYEVRPGDTFQTISLHFWKSTRYADRLVKANPSIDPKRLRPGMRIVVPQEPASIRSDIKEIEKTVPARRAYTVRQGDTLNSIAERECGSPRALSRIRELNPGLKDALRPGDQVYLPTGRF